MATAGRQQTVADKSGSPVPDDLVVVGKITTVHGVQGWVKIHSFTVPESNLVDYRPWWLAMPQGLVKLEIDQVRSTARGFLAHIAGVDDRDTARLYCQREIHVPASVFPATGEGEHYWHQLEGFRVISCYAERETPLGVVSRFFETGANDVMVVNGDAESLDRSERLIPYIDDFIVDVDSVARVIRVDWDPDFETS